MARSIVGNRATSGSDQRSMYDQLLHPTTDRTINRGDRSYDQPLMLFLGNTLTVSPTVLITIPLRQGPLGVDIAGIQGMQ